MAKAATANITLKHSDVKRRAVKDSFNRFEIQSSGHIIQQLLVHVGFLLDELFALEDPYNCPHGRPTIIRLTRSELDRRFRRVL